MDLINKKVKISDIKSLYHNKTGHIKDIFDAGMYDPSELFMIEFNPCHSGMFTSNQFILMLGKGNETITPT